MNTGTESRAETPQAAMQQAAKHQAEFVRQALSIQAHSGTVGAVEFLTARGVGQDAVCHALLGGLRSRGREDRS